mgnify:CR=1 FL=1
MLKQLWPLELECWGDQILFNGELIRCEVHTLYYFKPAKLIDFPLSSEKRNAWAPTLLAFPVSVKSFNNSSCTFLFLHNACMSPYIEDIRRKVGKEREEERREGGSVQRCYFALPKEGEPLDQGRQLQGEKIKSQRSLGVIILVCYQPQE